MAGLDSAAPCNRALDGVKTCSCLAETASRRARRHQRRRRHPALDGVTFICDGAIRTAGLKAARDGNRFPGAVLGVPVNRSGSRIHLLQAAENSLDTIDGTCYGRMVAHYANGESWKFDLLFGIHGDDWEQGKRAASEPVADPNSKVAWVQRRTGDNMFLRLYNTTVENPVPGITITSVDFISPLSEPNLLLFGLTIDDDSRPLSPSYGPGESIREVAIESITFTLQDAASRPASGATLAWTAVGPRVRIDFPSFPADALGHVRIDVPRHAIRQIRYKASAPDGSNAAGEFKAAPNGAFPSAPVIKLAS